jgi:hypothetical protein
MKRTAFLVAMALAALGLILIAAPKRFAATAQAQEKMAGKEGTWKGEIVDLACYLEKGAKGEGHKKCALMCAQMGQPVGLLTTDGKLFLLVGPHEGSGLDEAKKLAGAQVELKGKALERDGLRGIEVASVTEQGRLPEPRKPSEGSR